MVGWVAVHLPGPLATVARSILTVLIVGPLVTAALLGFTSIAGGIAGPCNEQLSEHLEAEFTGRRPGAVLAASSCSARRSARSMRCAG